MHIQLHPESQQGQIQKEKKKETSSNKRKIVFRHGRAPGDNVMFTCLYHHSPVLMGDGSKEYLGKLVNSKSTELVQTYDLSTNSIVPKPISGWVKNPMGNKWYSAYKNKWYFLTYYRAATNNKNVASGRMGRGKEKRGIYLTGDHLVFTKEGKKRVDELQASDFILTIERALNLKQRQLFTGTMLGDSCLRYYKNNPRRSAFSFKHSVKQKEWFDIKYKCFSDFDIHKVFEKGGKSKKKNDTYIAYTPPSAEFGAFFELWYRGRDKDKRKVLPSNIYKDFSWLTLATWYLDDGSLLYHGSALLCTDSFSLKDIERLVYILSKPKFGLKAKVQQTRRDGKKINRIYIGNGHDREGSADRFFENITKYVPLSLRYKIPKKYHYIKYNSGLWRLGASSPYYDTPTVQEKNPPDSRISNYSYCLEVEDNHNFIVNDIVVSNCGIRDFCLLFPQFQVGVHKKYPWIWENNPYIDHDLKGSDPGVEYYEVGYPAVGYANNTNVHFTQMFLLDMIAAVDLYRDLPISLGEFCSAFANGHVGDPRMGSSKGLEPFKSLETKYAHFCKNFARQKGDIHLSEQEKNDNFVKDVYGVEHYWIVAPGGKSDFTAKQWDWRRFQKVVDYFDGLIKFVVIGSSEAQMFLQSYRGAINLIDKFNGGKIRGLIPLIYHSSGVISTPSLIMHLGAAVPKKDGRDKPGVTIFGGREPTAWSWYCSYQILHNNAAFSCCKDGGCWKARTYPFMKHPEKNTSLCKYPVEVDGRTIQGCMDSITHHDVIRAIEKYYEGDLYEYDREKPTTSTIDGGSPPISVKDEDWSHSQKIELNLFEREKNKEINLVGNLNSKGGGEQSLIKIGQVLQQAGWKVKVYSAKHKVHENYANCGLDIDYDHSLEYGNIHEVMKSGIPLLFYANDTTRMFVDNAEEIVNKSSGVVIGINYVNRPLCDCRWLGLSGKVKAVIFQNTEKMEEWEREEVGYSGLKKIILFGAVDLDKFLEICPAERKGKEPLIVVKHCLPDGRKWVTTESKGRGEKIHLWQKHMQQDLDIKFYKRLLDDIKNIKFEFMEAPKELEEAFRDDNRMKFYKFNEISVVDFLAKGHVFMHRCSPVWRDQYPRILGEAMAAGLPCIVEPRDGNYERMKGGYGDRGFLAVDYDGFQYALKLFLRKENYRKEVGLEAKTWARKNLDPTAWVKVIEEIFL